mgnify:CR=1 FL=1
MADEWGSDAQRRAFLTELGVRARGVAWSPWGQVARSVLESWERAQGATVPTDSATGGVVPAVLPALGPARLLLRSGEPMTVTGVPFPRDVRGAVFMKRTDAVLQEWILAVATPVGTATVSLREGAGSWRHQVDGVGNRFFNDGSGGFTLCTPWGTALSVDAEGYLVEWDSRGAGVLRREFWGEAFAGVVPAGFLCRSGHIAAAYFSGAGRVMKILTRGYFDSRAPGSNRGLLTAGRLFVADVDDGVGAWQEVPVGGGPPAAQGMEAPVLSTAVDEATGAIFVERTGGWLRIVDDGVGVRAAAVDESSVPLTFTLRARAQRLHGTGGDPVLAAAWTGDALLTVTRDASGAAFVWRLNHE